MKNERLKYMDGLKGLLAICIVCFHYYTHLCNRDASLIPIPITALFTEGRLAVEMFFMISGFLMANKYANKQFDLELSQYLYPKCLRILPCFVLINILNAIISLVDNYLIKSATMAKVTLWGFVMSCIPFNYGWISVNYTQFLGAGWFISVLFLCYIIYFGILKIGNKWRSTYLALCVFIIFFGWSTYQMNLSIPFLYGNTTRGYICFFVGVLLSQIFKKKFNKKLLSVLGLILIGTLLLLAHKHGFERVFGHITYSFSFIVFPIILLAVTTLGILQKILSAQPFIYLGKISMSVFLMHLSIVYIIRLINWGGGVLNRHQL